MNDMSDGTLDIPDYQRDSDQWDQQSKSLLIESVINNLTIPAFFFEISFTDDVEHNAVVDGQQRLTTLNEFWLNKLRLVEGADAPYLAPNSVHYAGKTFDELPAAYKQAFKKYRLTVIKLRDLGDMRLEVFRRINRGGEPLSGQDIRLAYYGDSSPSLAFVRLVGIHEPDRPGAKRILASTKRQYGFDIPWSKNGFDTWSDWWTGKNIARGQTASEGFLWSLVSVYTEQLNQLLKNPDALAKLRCSYNGSIDTALDAFAAQLQYQDNNDAPALFATNDQITQEMFPYYQDWIQTLLVQKGPSLAVTKHRLVSGVIGAAYALKIDKGDLNDKHWDDLVEFIRSPRNTTEIIDVDWPASKGKWEGPRGYNAQFLAIRKVLQKILA
jgi:Protein of unknown function DUF262